MKGYFSRIRMRQNLGLHPAVARSLSEGYGLHKSLWKLFSETGDEERDFLYRQVDRQESPTFYAVSRRPPKDDDGIWGVETKPFEPVLTQGEQLAFSLRASATCCVKDPATGKPRRHDVVLHQIKHAGDEIRTQDVVQQVGVEWLASRGEAHGFRLLNAHVNARQTHKLFPKGKAAPIHYSTLDLEGVLEVTDPEIFRRTLFHGIGRSKGFGCGMLLIKRA